MVPVQHSSFDQETKCLFCIGVDQYTSKEKKNKKHLHKEIYSTTELYTNVEAYVTEFVMK